VFLHSDSHAMVDAAPSLASSRDTNSVRADAQPWLQSLNGFNTHGQELPLIRAGGITSMLILPGSAGNIGGQAFVAKPRITREDSPSSMVVESPFAIVKEGNGTTYKRTGHWRHMKQAMGENPLRVYGFNRLDQAAEFRLAYLEGQKLMKEQDAWCAAGEENTTPFPEDFKYEVLADVIRGKVKVNTHSYTTADFDMFVRLTNEFKWAPATMHHAHEAYLATNILDKAYGGKPALAIFATNARYKQESYLGSPYAAYILDQAGYEVCFKSDHPVLDSRYLPYEAQQGVAYGLKPSTALKAITVTPANRLGLGHRLGHLLEGYDADAVVWDSNPLVLGATPVQTYIDGIPQLEQPFTIVKPGKAQEMPKPVDVSVEAEETMKYRGNPPLEAKHQARNVVFQGVSSVFLQNDETLKVEEIDFAAGADAADSIEDVRRGSEVHVVDGEIRCIGRDCVRPEGMDFDLVDLKGGVITTGLTAYGSYLGLMEIRQEKVTTDGTMPDTLTEESSLLKGLVVYGSDGANFGGKDQLIAYAHGVTKAIAHPIQSGIFQGVSYSYATNGKTSLDGIVDEVGAVHVGLGQGTKMSTSTHIGVLRALLSGEYEDKTELTRVFKGVAKGDQVLVVDVNKADIMAALIRLKREFPSVRMTFEGGHESWMVSLSRVAWSLDRTGRTELTVT
jgi:imidazolonepropionase-like amidohydrolase